MDGGVHILQTLLSPFKQVVETVSTLILCGIFIVIGKLCPSVMHRVQQDDNEYYQKFAQSHSDESLPTLWKTLKPLLPRASAKRAKQSALCWSSHH